MPRSLILTFVRWLCGSLSAQLPASGSLSDKERPLFRAQVGRIEKLLSSSSDPERPFVVGDGPYVGCGVLAGENRVASKVVDQEPGLDPSRDSVFSTFLLRSVVIMKIEQAQ